MAMFIFSALGGTLFYAGSQQWSVRNDWKAITLGMGYDWLSEYPDPRTGIRIYLKTSIGIDDLCGWLLCTGSLAI
jgi:hypothetical protein